MCEDILCDLYSRRYCATLKAYLVLSSHFVQHNLFLWDPIDLLPRHFKQIQRRLGTDDENDELTHFTVGLIANLAAMRDV